MGKKKFIDKKKAATFRLVFKETSAGEYAEGFDRTFMRVDGGNARIPGFEAESVFDDAEEEEDVSVASPPRPSLVAGRRGLASIPVHVRQELLDLGFPDDGYNYLQHLRDIGASGRTGSFVPNSNLRLDLLPPDVKAYDASKVRLIPSDEESQNDPLRVTTNVSRLRGSYTSKALDPDVAALLEEGSDLQSLESADELEDDFVIIANQNGDKTATQDCTSKDEELDGALESVSEISDSDEEGPEGDGKYERPARFLDEQFELLALREYEDSEIGELDDEDPQAQGPDHISKFSDVLSDFLTKDTPSHDKYQTPAEIEGIRKKTHNCNEYHLIEERQHTELQNGGCNSSEYESPDEKELVIAYDTDEDGKEWDCETVVTTYSNLDNHPCQISASDQGLSSKGRSSGIENNRTFIRLQGKQQLPIDYLPGKVSLHKNVKKKNHVSNHDSFEIEEMKQNLRRRVGESKEEKKARKAAVKEEKRIARITKKETKVLYKDESQRAQHSAASTGPGTLHLL